MRFLNTLVGLLLDVFDWVAVGMIPGAGDIIDVIGAIWWYKQLGVEGVAAAIELIPGLDILPTNLVLGLLADHRRRGE